MAPVATPSPPGTPPLSLENPVLIKPRNDAMEARQPMTTHDTEAQDIAAQLKSEGWCVVRDVIPRSALALLHEVVTTQAIAQREEWEAVASKIRARGQQQPPDGIGRAQGLMNHVPALARHATDARIIQPVERVLGPSVRVASVSGLVNHPRNERGYWHADWPFNGKLATHMQAPYADMPMQISGIFMITPFSPATGGTLIVPRSHRLPNNPSYNNGVDRLAPHPGEMQVSGDAGSLLLYDSRLWHAVATNCTDTPRVAVTIRYAPWWFNLEMRRKGSPDFKRLVAGASGKENSVPLIPKSVFQQFHEDARPYFMHWVDQ
jgi:ectoine hydroxylase-related dioxygenase (phytanoyl-CoA dioxygenase family)